MKQTIDLAQLGPLEQLRTGRMTRRLVQLMVGLTFFGISSAMMIRGNLGVAPWDALHVGISQHIDVSYGWIVFFVSVLVMVLWIPLREKPGIGTIANAIVISIAADVTLRYLGSPSGMVGRLVLTLGGVALCGLGSAMYIGAQLGRGPRDGLMTGFSRLTGMSLRSIRTMIEVTVVVLGVILAGLGVLGVGTVLFALLIGPLTQMMLPWVLVKMPSRRLKL